MDPTVVMIDLSYAILMFILIVIWSRRTIQYYRIVKITITPLIINIIAMILCGFILGRLSVVYLPIS